MGLPKAILLVLFLPFLWFQTCKPTPEKSKAYIVHMDTSQMPTNMASRHHWYNSLVNSAKLLNTQGPDQMTTNRPAPLLYTYNHVLDGFSAVLSPEELAFLKTTPGFMSAYPDAGVTLHTTRTTDFLSLNPKTGLWPASKHGNDVIIGVIDTGVWPESPSFGDDGMPDKIPKRWNGTCAGEQFSSLLCNKKLIGVRYFNKGIMAANPNTTIYMNSGRDDSGHGSHTSATAAGNYVQDASFFGYAPGTAKGVAPRARLAMYKVMWGEVGYTSDVLAGMDMAVSDGVDVISISLGGTSFIPVYEDAVAIASFGAMEKGILVSAAAGNEGPAPLGSLSNGFPWVLTTAAGSVDRSYAGTLRMGNGKTITGWTTYPVTAIIDELPLVYNKTISACTSTRLLSDFIGSIVVCKTENYDSFLDQCSVLAKSEVGAAIFVIDDDPDVFESPGFPYPGIMISKKHSRGVIKYARNVTNAYASIQFQETMLGVKAHPVVASYSSRGPSPFSPGILKPDLMAPGTLVLAAWTPKTSASYISPNIDLSSPFNLISGTSIACPHSSGIAALLKGAHPDWSPAAIRSAMITTANPNDNTNAPIKDPAVKYSIASPLSMGAGQVDPNRALDPGLIYNATTLDYVNLLCSMNFTLNQIRTITRSKYNCSNPSSDLNYPSFILLYALNKNGIAASATATNVTRMFKRTVTSVGDDPEMYVVDDNQLPRSFEVSFDTRTLSFMNKYETAEYALTLTYKGSKKGEVEFGSVAWVGDSGKHKVRSPVVVAPMINIY
ncbi:hypothetical protein DM860_012213 [Cuscuta australis]|uniref:Subtilisin-like protease fibronectin type-III domain-containing protein n=1 Tax=Cuscuta australis TaxID=267555 RepID=A0A328EAA9_9ASTE|nr:hypothetical protein DM860_012213 [Cuscuta australis]